MSDRKRIGNPAADAGFEQAKKLGYATADSSPVLGINTVSAPVFDHTGQMQLAATPIGPVSVVDIRPGSPQLERLLAFTADLSAKLGYAGPATNDPPADGKSCPFAEVPAEAAGLIGPRSIQMRSRFGHLLANVETL
jgi:hypothetical protein